MTMPQDMLYAAIDGAAFDDLPKELAGIACPAQCLYLGDKEPAVTAAAPWLATIGRADAQTDALTWFRDRAAKTPCGVLIRSRAPFTELRRQLRSLNLAHVPAGGDVLFRWYDPRILPAALAVLEPPQVVRLYGPVEAFAVVEPSGHMTELSRRPPSNVDPARGFLHFNHDQMARLEEHLQGDILPPEMADFLKKYLPSAVAGLSDEALFRRVRFGIARGRAWGITSSEGLVWFVRRMFVISPSFDRLPAIKQVLSNPALSEIEKINHLRAPEQALLWGKAAMLDDLWE